MHAKKGFLIMELIARYAPAGCPAIRLANLMIVAYNSGNIGVIAVDENGRTKKQVAYFDREKGQWLKNEKQEGLATEPIKL
jgi:hypothetical protein